MKCLLGTVNHINILKKYTEDMTLVSFLVDTAAFKLLLREQ